MAYRTYVNCTYCDNTWIETQYEWSKDKCERCGDENLKRKKVELVDFYQTEPVGFKKRSS